MRPPSIIHRPARPDDVLVVAVPETTIAVVTVRTRRGLRRRTRRVMVPGSSPTVAVAVPGDRRRRRSVEVRTPTTVRRAQVAASPGGRAPARA